jgi:cytochrome c oxidase cbb3-type subunit 3
MCVLIGLSGRATGQNAGPLGGQPARVSAYPEPAPAAPEVVARGKQLFSTNCTFCHGPDARGGESGPNLLRSETLLNDHNGELLAPVIKTGRPDKGMPKFDLTDANIADLAGFLHSIRINNRGAAPAQVNILVGDARAGKAYFNGAGKCTSCHSTTGDLADIGKYDPKAIQNAFVSGGKFLAQGMPSKLPPSQVEVTTPDGHVARGTLRTIDDFVVTVVLPDGHYQSFVRHKDVPHVVVTNPVQAHIDLLRTITDDQVHNITAYLVTIKK